MFVLFIKSVLTLKSIFFLFCQFVFIFKLCYSFYCNCMNRKIKLIGHFLRHNQFITIIMEWEINGKRTNRGRPHKSLFEEIFQLMNFTLYQKLKKTASDNYKRLQRLRFKNWDSLNRTIFVVWLKTYVFGRILR